jgi:PBSX family phage portal protein
MPVPDDLVVDLDGTLGRNRDEKDPFDNYYNKFPEILTPPVRPNSMYQLYEDSDVYQSCVKAKQRNVDGFGYMLQYKGDDTNKKDKDVVRQEKALQNFYDFTNEEESMRAVRVKCREDFEVLGNMSLEATRYPKSNQLAMLYYNPTVDTRMTILDEKPIRVRYKVWRDGELRTLYVKKKFRRFAQMMDATSTTTPIKWFKSFGVVRIMDAITGEFYDTKRQCKEVATEILWIKNNFGGKAYGMPPVIGSVTDIMGRSRAQYVNFDLFDNQGIPRMVLLVENGSLSDESRIAVRQMLESFRGATNFNRVGIIEAVADTLGLDEGSNVRITLKSLTDFRSSDEQFKTYQDDTYNYIRQAFRIPALYLGGVGAYSYASAYTAQSIAEQQVFVPERLLYDEIINRLITWGELVCPVWEYKSKGPQTVGAEELRRALKELGDVGAFSVDHAIDLANNMFGLQMSKYNQEWSKAPVALVKLAINAKTIDIPELGIVGEALGLPTNEPPAEPKKKDPPLKVAAVE